MPVQGNAVEDPVTQGIYFLYDLPPHTFGHYKIGSCMAARSPSLFHEIYSGSHVLICSMLLSSLKSEFSLVFIIYITQNRHWLQYDINFKYVFVRYISTGYNPASLCCPNVSSSYVMPQTDVATTYVNICIVAGPKPYLFDCANTCTGFIGNQIHCWLWHISTCTNYIRKKTWCV